MSDLTDDRTDAGLEALLRATFAAEARQQIEDARTVPPLRDAGRVATVRSRRRRRIGLSAVAAALVAVLVGAAVIGHEAMDAHRTPVPAGTGVGADPTLSASPSASVGRTPTSSPTSSPPASTVSTPAGAPTRQVTFRGVVLTVPAAWNVVDRPVGEAGDTPSICLTTDTVIRSTGTATSDCELNVSVGAGLWGSHDVDRVDFAPDGGLCGTDRHQPHQTDTVVADELAVDGQNAEHREFTGSCLDHVLDQWTVPTTPFVQFWRDFGPADPAGRAQALEAVRSARLPGPRSALRWDDHGYITAVSGNTVSLDRVTHLNQLGVENSNPATYAYPVAADATVTYHGSALSLDQLRTLGAGGTVAGVPPLDTLEAELTTNGSAVTELVLSDRPS